MCGVDPGRLVPVKQGPQSAVELALPWAFSVARQFGDSSLKPTGASLETPLVVRENRGTGANRGKQSGGEDDTTLFTSVISVSSVSSCKKLPAYGLLGIAGRDRRGLSQFCGNSLTPIFGRNYTGSVHWPVYVPLGPPFGSGRHLEAVGSLSDSDTLQIRLVSFLSREAILQGQTP